MPTNSATVEIKRPKENIGIGFDLFPEFPRETRNMTLRIRAYQGSNPYLWKQGSKLINVIFSRESLLVLVHATNMGGSSSDVQTVLQSCREARLKGLNLQLPYYRVNEGHYEGYEAGYDCPYYYFKPEVDIVWLPDK